MDKSGNPACKKKEKENRSDIMNPMNVRILRNYV